MLSRTLPQNVGEPILPFDLADGLAKDHRATLLLTNSRPVLRRVLRRVLEIAFEKVLRRVLRKCLAVGFNGKKGSEKGS